MTDDELTQDLDQDGGRVHPPGLRLEHGVVRGTYAPKILRHSAHVELVPIHQLLPFREFHRLERPGLRDHIARHGVVSPVTIGYSQADRTAKIEEGNHRLQEAHRLGHTHVPAVVMRRAGPFAERRAEGAQRPQPVRGIEPNRDGYVPTDLRPSQIGFTETIHQSDLQHPVPGTSSMKKSFDRVKDLLKSFGPIPADRVISPRLHKLTERFEFQHEGGRGYSIDGTGEGLQESHDFQVDLKDKGHLRTFEHTHTVGNSSRTRRVHFDPSHADVHVSDIGYPYAKLKASSPLKDRIEHTSQPHLMYRGMSHEEFHEAKARGYIQSKGEYNLGGTQEGRTYYSKKHDSAESYAHSFAPLEHKATPGRHAYVVAVHRPHDWESKRGPHDPPDEIGLHGAIPWHHVQHVWEGHVYGVNPGSSTLYTDRYSGHWGKYREGTSSQPSLHVGWKDATTEHAPHVEAQRAKTPVNTLANPLQKALMQVEELLEKARGPVEYYRGSNPGDDRRITTGDPHWDSHLFVTKSPHDARQYGSHIEKVTFKPGSKILVEGTREFRSAPKWREGQSLLEWASSVTKHAAAHGYDAVHFQRQTDVGTAIMNHDAVVRSAPVPYAEHYQTAPTSDRLEKARKPNNPFQPTAPHPPKPRAPLTPWPTDPLDGEKKFGQTYDKAARATTGEPVHPLRPKDLEKLRRNTAYDPQTIHKERPTGHVPKERRSIRETIAKLPKPAPTVAPAVSPAQNPAVAPMRPMKSLTFKPLTFGLLKSMMQELHLEESSTDAPTDL